MAVASGSKKRSYRRSHIVFLLRVLCIRNKLASVDGLTMVASARNRWWFTGAMKMLLKLGNLPCLTHAWASTSYFLVRVHEIQMLHTIEKGMG